MGFEPVLSRWPPLRLARVSRELVSVVVVCPLLLRWFTQSEEDEVKSAGRAVGLDVHRDFCEVAIAQHGKVSSSGRVDTTPEALELFGGSLDPRDRVALEVSGSAWEVARILERHVAQVVVVSPADTGIRQARAKTDRLDARTLARLLAAGELDGVWSPDEGCRVMRRRLSRREQLVRARSRAKNEIHAVLVRRLVGRPPVSDVFGVKGRRWLAGLDLPVEETETIQACLRHVEFLDGEIAAVERHIATAALDSKEIRRLMTIPGVYVICAATFMAAVGDIRRFSNPRSLAGYLGLDPASTSWLPPATGAHLKAGLRLNALGARRGGLERRPPAWSAARLLSARARASWARDRDRRQRAQARVPVLVPAHPRTGLRPPSALTDRQEATAARDPRRRPHPEGHPDRRVGHQTGNARGRAQARRGSRGLLQADGPRLASSHAEKESGRERDTGARITKALKGQSRAADHEPLTSALRLVLYSRPQPA